MIIDFKYNAEIRDMVQYFYPDGTMAVQFPYSELEKWADKKFTEMDAEEVDEYIDDNWVKVSTDFYHFKNPTEYKSNNTEQETRKQVG